MKKPKDLVGQTGEILARDFLIIRRYQILDQNYRCSLGEIDLIACKKKTISFIEVKTRTSQNFGHPENSVTKRKQTKLARLALAYLQKKRLKNVPCNFGVISILLKDETPEINFFENAFNINELLPPKVNY